MLYTHVCLWYCITFTVAYTLYLDKCIMRTHTHDFKYIIQVQFGNSICRSWGTWMGCHMIRKLKWHKSSVVSMKILLLFRNCVHVCVCGMGLCFLAYFPYMLFRQKRPETRIHTDWNYSNKIFTQTNEKRNWLYIMRRFDWRTSVQELNIMRSTQHVLKKKKYFTHTIILYIFHSVRYTFEMRAKAVTATWCIG